MTGLEGHVGFVVALVSIHRPHHGELVEHRRLLGQEIADEDTRLSGLDHAKGAAVVERAFGLRIPRINVAGSPAHPQQDHGLAAGHLPTGLGGMGTFGQQAGQRQAGQASHRYLHHATTVQVHQALALTRIQTGESVVVRMHPITPGKSPSTCDTVS